MFRGEPDWVQKNTQFFVVGACFQCWVYCMGTVVLPVAGSVTSPAVVEQKRLADSAYRYGALTIASRIRTSNNSGVVRFNFWVLQVCWLF